MGRGAGHRRFSKTYRRSRVARTTFIYGPGAEQVWGLNLTRHIRRKNEQVVWSSVPRQYGFFRLTEAGLLQGSTAAFEELRQVV